MKILRVFTVLTILCISKIGFGVDRFDCDQMQIVNDRIYLITPLFNRDVVTAYTINGTFLWEVPFHTKILSLKIYADRIFVFSQKKQSEQTYLSCLDPYTGLLYWERP